MESVRKVLSYNDVLLVPRYSGLDHISDADIKINYNLASSPFISYPIFNAPMDKVCSTNLLGYLSNELNMPTTIHRWFYSFEDQLEFYKQCSFKNNNNVFLAVGILSKWKHWIDGLLNYRCDHSNVKFGILIDVANGDTKASIETVQYIRRNFPSNINIMAGNVAARSGFARLQEAGANFIRVGIGGGSICSTRIQTAFGVPTLTSVIDCAREKDTAYLIADGGIECPGDICKAIAAGADGVMLGKMLAATSLSNSEKVDVNGTKYVKYSGMASKEAIDKLNSNKSVISIEGVSGLIPYTGETEVIVKEILGNLQTAVSYYAGCRNWNMFRKKVKFIEITTQGWEESKTRVML